MSTTPPLPFADMTPDQRQQCAGMWADVTWDSEKPLLAIIFSIPRQDFVQLIEPSTGQAMLGADPKRVIPRVDLPRAWNPDGTPVDADLEEYTADTYGYVWPQRFEETGQPQGTRVRRWVSDWEAVE